MDPGEISFSDISTAFKQQSDPSEMLAVLELGAGSLRVGVGVGCSPGLPPLHCEGKIPEELTSGTSQNETF